MSSELGIRAGEDDCQIIGTEVGLSELLDLITRLGSRIPDHEHLATPAWGGSELMCLRQFGGSRSMQMLTIIVEEPAANRSDVLCTQVGNSEEVHLYLSLTGLGQLAETVRELIRSQQRPCTCELRLPTVETGGASFRDKPVLEITILTGPEFQGEIAESSSLKGG